MIYEEDYVGKYIGKYLVTAEIARGAFGNIYLAQHPYFKARKVAIKRMIHLRLETLEERETFLQEAELLDELKHPHILFIYDIEIDKDIPYIVTEYAPNGSLRDRVKQHIPLPMALDEAISVITQIGEALHFAHSKNIVHRDLKPENILFNACNQALLADFGLAVKFPTSSSREMNVSGTPTYMAPEQFRGLVSMKSDQYSLGIIAYELMTGRKAFEADNVPVLALRHMMTIPAPPSQYNQKIPPHVERAILKAISKGRTDRFTDIAAFLDALHPRPPKTLIAFVETASVHQQTKEEWLNGGLAHFAVKRYDSALASFDRALRLDPDDSSLHYNRASALHYLSRHEEALIACERALELDPHLHDAYVLKSLILCDLGRCQEAVAAYDAAIRIEPEKVIFYYMKGILLRRLKQYDQALYAFDSAIQLEPNDMIMHYYRATTLLNLRWYEAALEAFDCVIALDPTYASAYRGKGDALKQIGRLKEAESAYELAERMGYKLENDTV